MVEDCYGDPYLFSIGPTFVREDRVAENVDSGAFSAGLCERVSGLGVVPVLLFMNYLDTSIP